MIGQVSGRLVVKVDDVAEVHGRHRDVLVLAELPVSRLQIDKIDPAEHLVLTHRLWIVQGGCDQILEVDVLDVEGLAHMRAARVQQLRDLLLVSHAIELRLHRVRRGGYRTKRESRRKDFYEDGFHGGKALALSFSKRLHPASGAIALLSSSMTTCRLVGQ